MNRSRRIAVTTLLPVLAALALSSCSAEDLAERAVERGIENAGGEDADFDFDTDTGEFSVETDEGSFSSGGDLPGDFPIDEVPLVDGDIVQAAASSQEGSAGFVVLVQVDDTVQDAVAAAEEQLLGAGFASDPELADVTGLDLVQVVKAPYTVVLTAYESEPGSVVNYVISIE